MMKKEVEVINAGVVKNIDELMESFGTVKELVDMRVKSAFDRANKTLTLSLKKQWFDLIKAGIKKEEYRERKDYWFNRFYHSMNPDGTSCKYDRLVFTLGYPKASDASRRIEFKNPKIRIGTGRPEWGAEAGKKYFVITWEDAFVTEEQNIEARR